MLRHDNGVARGKGRGAPFNAVFRRLMQENTVQIKIWSHARNSGRLGIELWGLRTGRAMVGVSAG